MGGSVLGLDRRHDGLDAIDDLEMSKSNRFEGKGREHDVRLPWSGDYADVMPIEVNSARRRNQSNRGRKAPPSNSDLRT